MNENAKRWVDALRGGAYRQTTQRLRRRSRVFILPAAYCAVGVLYDLYLKDRGEPWSARPPCGELPAEALEWAGVPRALERDVVLHNDQGRDFAQIASIIEAYFHRASRNRRWAESERVARRGIEAARHASRRAVPASADSSDASAR